jgi:ATP-binding cassette subfamily C protein CydD
MVKSKTSLVPHLKPDPRASLWWVVDSFGAVLFAAGLAMAVSGKLTLAANLAWPLLLLAAGGALRALAIGRAQIAGQAAAARVQSSLRAILYHHLLPTRLMRGRLIGEDMHLAVHSVAATEGLIARFLPLRMASGVVPIFIAVAVAPASWVASSIMLATLLPFILGMVLAGGAAARQAQAQHHALSRLSGLFVDRLRSLPTILAFSAEDRVTRHLGDAAQDVARRTMAVLGIAFASSAILEFFAALSVALVAVYCGFSLLGLLPFPAPEHLTLGRAFYALALAPEFYLALRRLAAAYHDKQQGEAAIEAIEAEIAEQPSPPASCPTPSSWSGYAVMLTHPDGAAIGPLNWAWGATGLHIISGPTGSGKSSLLLALIGQVPISGGTITIDGQPFAAGSLNAHIGWAGQQVALLPATLRANLAFGSADDAAMLACLHRLGLAPMLAQRGGLDLVIDHRDSGLSGGERRRIGLARALLSGRPILMLDEPTADLDEQTAANVRAILADCAKTQMVVAASHDAALIAMARSRCEVTA